MFSGNVSESWDATLNKVVGWTKRMQWLDGWRNRSFCSGVKACEATSTGRRRSSYGFLSYFHATECT